MKTLLLLLAIIVSQAGHAQFWKEKLKNAKETIKEKASNKIDTKINTGVDNGIEKIDSIATGKKKIGKKNKAKNTVPEETGADGTISGFESSELILQTSINTVAAKEKMETLLREMDGISSVSIDSDTGIAYISPSSEQDISKSAIALIKQNGFTAKIKSNKK